MPFNLTLHKHLGAYPAYVMPKGGKAPDEALLPLKSLAVASLTQRAVDQDQGGIEEGHQVYSSPTAASSATPAAFTAATLASNTASLTRYEGPLNQR